MSNARQTFEAIARANGGTDFSLKPDGRYAVQNIQSRWAYFRLGWKARRTWVGLTQQDIDIAFDDTQEGGGFDDFARAIEAKLKEKNGY